MALRDALRIVFVFALVSLFASAFLANSFGSRAGWRCWPVSPPWPAVESQQRLRWQVEHTSVPTRSSEEDDVPSVAIGDRSERLPVALALACVPLLVLFVWRCWPVLKS